MRNTFRVSTLVDTMAPERAARGQDEKGKQNETKVNFSEDGCDVPRCRAGGVQYEQPGPHQI